MDKQQDNEDSQSAMEASGMTDIKRKKRTDKPSVNQKSTQQAKLGILLIDHGSKKQSSNDALHSIADRYESILLQRLEETSFSILHNFENIPFLLNISLLVRLSFQAFYNYRKQSYQ